MLGSPSVAVLEQVLPGLFGSAAPPALVVLPQFDPLQVSSRKGAPCTYSCAVALPTDRLVVGVRQRKEGGGGSRRDVEEVGALLRGFIPQQ